MTNADRIAILVLNGLDDDQIERAAAEQLDMSPADVTAAIAEARRRITLAADYRRDEQLGLAIRRLNHCYATAQRVGDVRAAITAQRALNELLTLDAAPPAVDAGDALADHIRDHLAPHTPETDDPYEMVRLAALRLTDE